MAKKAKQNVDKIVKKVNKEFEKTSSQIEGLVNDALKQFDSLQNQVQEPVRKLLKEIDELLAVGFVENAHAISLACPQAWIPRASAWPSTATDSAL